MNRLALGCALLVLSIRMASNVHAQTPVDIRDLKLRDWEPRSMLVSRTTNVLKAKFPVVDVHSHLGGGKAMLTPERVARYLAEMDAAGVRTVVNLDGGWDERLEETLAAHPDIAEAAVIGVSDDAYGQRLRSFIVVRPGAALTEQEVKDYVKGRLARFKVPRDVRFVDALPRNPTGKVLKGYLDGEDGRQS